MLCDETHNVKMYKAHLFIVASTVFVLLYISKDMY